MMESELCGEITLSKLQEIEKNVKEYKNKCLVQIDEDEILSVNTDKELVMHLSPWQNDVFDCIEALKAKTFSLLDVYKFEQLLQSKHSNNKHIKAKIRQILRQLRDLGYIIFTSPGQYKKLWACMEEEKITNHLYSLFNVS